MSGKVITFHQIKRVFNQESIQCNNEGKICIKE